MELEGISRSLAASLTDGYLAIWTIVYLSMIMIGFPFVGISYSKIKSNLESRS